jgi:hypothetical protein
MTGEKNNFTIPAQANQNPVILSISFPMHGQRTLSSEK